MAKAKTSISGMRIAPGVIEVELSGRKDLMQGQKVLIYKPTNKSIVGTTGKIIGQKEKVLGVGEVSVIGDKVVVKARGSNTRKLSYVRNGSVKALTRAYKVKKTKFSSPKLGNRVFIKPVEE